MIDKYENVLSALRKAMSEIRQLDISERKIVSMQRRILPVIAEITAMMTKDQVYDSFNGEQNTEIIEA